MLLDDVKYFINNVRSLLKEDASTSSLTDAINKRKYIYLYYSGDNTIMTGYRIVKPYALGKTKNGDLVLRAWQTEGFSDGFAGILNRKRLDHEYFRNPEGGKDVPGWRLFRVDKITRILPTGSRFDDIPPNYTPNDSQMKGGVIAAVPHDIKGGEVEVDGIGSVEKPSVVKYGGGRRRKVTKRDIEDLYDVVRKIKKKSTGDYVVYRDEQGNFKVTPASNEDKIDKKDFIGNLKDLYINMVLPSKPVDNQFFEKKKREIGL
jgi:hypothetical protein